MSKTAWQCSQCGTINEPGARACRNCGKWPSLFDLQDGAVEEAGLEELRELDFEVEEFEPETFESETFEPDREAADEPTLARRRRRRKLMSAVWPIALLVYLVISFLSNR